MLAAIVSAQTVSAQTAAGQSPRGPGVNWDYGTIAEGYTSAVPGGPVEAAHRMFSAPDFADVCARARAGAVKSLRAVPAQVDARVGVWVPYENIRVDALDARGGLVPRVPIDIETYMWSEVLDKSIADGFLKPQQAGTIRLRIRTTCDAPGGEVFVTVHVVR